jgi:hypothetical protein
VRLRASTPAELAATVPYLFGFPPRDCVVVLSVDGTRVAAAARLDEAVIASPPHDLRARLGGVLAQGGRHVVLGFLDDVARARQMVDTVAGALGPVDQTVLVCDGRCQAGDGPWVACAGVAAAEQAGLHLMPDRASVAAQVAGPADEQQAQERWDQAEQNLAARGSGWRGDRATALVRQSLVDETPLTESELMELAVLVADGRVRDRLWPLLTGKTARPLERLWQAVLSVTPAGGAAAPLGLCGMAAWVAGEGVVQSCCLERGLALEPRHSLLRLLESINLVGIHPKAWQALRRSLVTEAKRQPVGADAPG